MTIEKLYALFLQHPIVTTDSRNCLQGSIFFALRGDTFDGNLFAAKALEAGCAYAVVDNPAVATTKQHILVDNTLETLRALAAYHRTQLNTPIIGVTGTNGKTTTKELIAAVLRKKYNVLYTEGNLNNHIGVPLTLLRLNSEHNIAIIEMGANHPGEIKENVEIVRPNYGIITNIGKAHLEGFGSFEGVVKTKGELYDFIRATGGTLFCNACDQLLMQMSEGIKRVLYASRNTQASLYGKTSGNSACVKFVWQQKSGISGHVVKTHLIGKYNLNNLLAATCIGCFFDVPEKKICEALKEYQPSNNRSQLLETTRNTLIVDTYNANPTSMEAALLNFAQINMPHKMVILGDMLELGQTSIEEHQHILDATRSMNLEKIILVGNEFKQLSGSEQHFDNVEQLISHLQQHPLQGHTILIKGSHGIHLERLIPQL